MQKISWGSLPCCFFKDAETGLSVNTAAMPCGKSDNVPLPMPQAGLMRMQAELAPNEESTIFLRGYEAMKQRLLNAEEESNPLPYLSQMLYHSVKHGQISHICLHPLREELLHDCPRYIQSFSCLQNYFIFCDCSLESTNSHSLVLLLEQKEQTGPAPSLYALRKELQQRNLPNLTVTVQNGSSYNRGILLALLQATALNLNYMLSSSPQSSLLQA